MYGKRLYGRKDKLVEPLQSDEPTFVCEKCRGIKTLNNPYIEITALEKQQLFMYTRLCASCAELLKVWLKQ